MASIDEYINRVKIDYKVDDRQIKKAQEDQIKRSKIINKERIKEKRTMDDIVKSQKELSDKQRQIRADMIRRTGRERFKDLQSGSPSSVGTSSGAFERAMSSRNSFSNIINLFGDMGSSINGMFKNVKTRAMNFFSALKGGFISLGLVGSAAMGWIINTSPALQVQLKIANLQLSAIGRTLGDQLVPFFEKFNELIKNTVDWFMSLNPIIIQTIAIAVGLSAAITVLAIVIGALTLVASPWLLIALAIVAVVSLLVAIFMNFGDIMTWITDLWANSSDGMRVLLVLLGLLIAPILAVVLVVQLLITHWATLVEWFNLAGEGLTSFGALLTNIGESLMNYGESATGFFGIISTIVGGLIMMIGDFVTLIGQLLRGDFTGALVSLGNMLVDIVNIFVDLLNNIIITPINTIIDGVNEFFEADFPNINLIPRLQRTTTGGGGSGSGSGGDFYELGGIVRNTGNAMLHKREVVLDRGQVSNLGGVTRASMLGRGGNMVGSTFAPSVQVTVSGGNNMDERKLVNMINDQLTQFFRRYRGR